MDFNQLKRLYYTLKHLKFTQVYHQIKYRLIKPKRVVTPSDGSFAKIDLIDFPKKKSSLMITDDKWCFDFLNIEHSFTNKSLDWSFEDYGMLWTYNLNYFDWLNQADMSKEQGIETLSQFYATHAEKNLIILNPYPTSLRIINIAKFISKWDIKEDWLYYQLLSDLKFLSGRLEYHLLANHLLENAFALYIGGLITSQKVFIRKGKKLLLAELKEQILNDGMHYERSSMYHLIILERLLDAFNFAIRTKDDLVSELKKYTIKMTGLAMNWQYLDRIPMMQDSAYDIALSVPVLLDYSKSLLGKEYPSKPNELQDSGYKNIKSRDLRLIANVGSIGPSYQPAHAHSDELGFELFYLNHPLVVNTGVSTYDKNEIRAKERSSYSHNCVSIKNKNLSDIWSGFRVGKRAIVTSKSEPYVINASCKSELIEILRKFEMRPTGLIIEDRVRVNNGEPTQGCLHIHPDIELQKLDSFVFKASDILISIFTDKDEVRIEDYTYCKGYNNRVPAKKLVYSIQNQANVEFRKV